MLRHAKKEQSMHKDVQQLQRHVRPRLGRNQNNESRLLQSRRRYQQAACLQTLLLLLFQITLVPSAGTLRERLVQLEAKVGLRVVLRRRAEVDH